MKPMQPEKFLEYFSSHLKNAIARSISLAGSLGHGSVTPVHLLCSLAEEKGGVAAEILRQVQIEPDYLLAFLHEQSRDARKSREVKLPGLNDLAKQALEKSMLYAYEHTQKYVGTEHLLSGILAVNDVQIEALLREGDIDKAMLRQAIEQVLVKKNKLPPTDDLQEVIERFHELVEHEGVTRAPALEGKKKGKAPPHLTALDVFTVNLTSKHMQKNLDPVIGREEEIERAIRILCRRTKNNPVLVGEPGVGKTAIVEGLAKKIAESAVPDALKRKKILALDLPLLLAGTMYRGEFEARLKQLVDELSARSDTILFIDEIHNIIGAGSNQGTMDAANILKPALARGLLRCIGATTIDEYQKYVAGDPALERRFQSIQIEEPSRDDTVNTLQGIKKYYEDFHHVTLTGEAIAAAVDLSIRYIHDNYLPDKAIDLIDEAGARVRVARADTAADKTKNKLLDELMACRTKKEQSIHQEELKEAVRWKEKEQQLEKRISALEKKANDEAARKRVTKADIARVLATKLHMDGEHLLRDEWEHIATVGEALKRQIIGQTHVIDELTRALANAHLGLGSGNKPFASFLFAGPSGVGKTALTRALAQELYRDPKALIKLDMTEFSEPHSVSKLLGSPAGYIGYRERNRFTEELRQRPYAVLVFDEYDKAHPDVQKLLFQILDEGELTDSHGKKIFFHHTIVILTTNIGAELYASGGMGFGEARKADESIPAATEQLIRSRLNEQLGSSLIGRIGRTLLFRPLTPIDTGMIIQNLFKTINEKLAARRRFSIVPDVAVVETLAKETLSPDTGVRSLEHKVENILHELITRDIVTKRQYTLTTAAGKYILR